MQRPRSKPIKAKHNPVITSESGKGQYCITAEVRFIGEDILASVWGGTKPHIGSIAVAQARPSLQDPRCISATSSVINFPGHKDDIVSKMYAERISSAMNCRCIATAGIHVDNASKNALSKILRNCETLCSRMVTILKG
jgi:hypothetical protein